MKTLHLTLKKIWFDRILNDDKKEEYRAIGSYWKKRIEGKDYDTITFRKGYRKDATEMIVEYLGWEIKDVIAPLGLEYETVYALKLGEILSIKRRVPLKKVENSNES